MPCRRGLKSVFFLKDEKLLCSLSLQSPNPTEGTETMIHLSKTATTRRLLSLIAILIFSGAGPLGESDACTNILVSRGASADGSVLVSFSVDGTGAGMLSVSPGGRKPAGENEHPSVADYKGPVYKVLNHINEYRFPSVKRPPTGAWNWPTKTRRPSRMIV